MKPLSRCAVAFLVALLSTSAAFAQSAGTGAISGVITDSGGAVVSQATISAIDVTTGEKRDTVSSSQGTYLVPLLLPLGDGHWVVLLHEVWQARAHAWYGRGHHRVQACRRGTEEVRREIFKSLSRKPNGTHSDQRERPSLS